MERKVGYKAGEWVDVGEWQIELDGSDGEPVETLSPSDVAGTPEWDKAMAAGLPHLHSK